MSRPTLADRLTRPFVLEPLRLLVAGVAGADEIDRLMVRMAGVAAGPFRWLDERGLDAQAELCRHVWEDLGRPARLEPVPLLAELAERGQAGVAAGRGFYDYGDSDYPLPAVVLPRQSFDAPPGVYKAVRRFVDAATQESGSFTEQYVFARTLAALINEAALACDEQCGSPEEIDAAVRGALGLPLGPLEWCGRIGRYTCAALLRRLAERESAERYRPADWLS